MDPDDTVNIDAPKPSDFAEGPPPAGTSKTATAFCPKCNGAMAPNEPLCPHCGYDFPFGGVDRGPGFVLSRVADIILIIAAGITGIASVVCVAGAVATLVNGEPWASMLLLLWAFVLLALAIVFLRVQRFEPRDSRRR